jgi:hypothetical protein
MSVIYPSMKYFNFLVVHPTLRLQLAMVQCNLFRERSDGCLPRATPSHSCQMQRSCIWPLYGLLPCRGLWPTFPHYFLTSFGINYKSPLPPTDIWCDNLAVVKTVNKITSRKRPELPNETLTPSRDILQAIRTKFHLHQLSLFHVKGHQDKSIDPSELPFQSQQLSG